MINHVETTNLSKIFEGAEGVAAPAGFFAGGVHCGIKRKRLDLGWIYSVVPATAAAVYTTNLFQAAPIKVTQNSIGKSKKIQGVIVNSGNANACTGDEGYFNALMMRRLFAEQMNIKEHLVAVSSTGVIGQQLPIHKVKDGIAMIHDIKAQNSPENFESAILTTDTIRKNASIRLEIAGTAITIGGAAKGSGMIHPNMATMLAFITTDAKVSEEALEQALKLAVNDTFNMITVDGDTSTNDMVLLLANGLAENEEITLNHPEWNKFLEGIKKVCEMLAKLIAADGEGATKLIEVSVMGAATEDDAKKIAKSVAGSNLVKAAVFGVDPNWGRIVTAAGYSGASFDYNNISVYLGPVQVAAHGLPLLFDEQEAKAYLENHKEIQLIVKLQDGNEHATAWGCDLTYDYVRINASYRT